MLAAVSLSVTVLVVGISLDYSRTSAIRQEMQDALDSATILAARKVQNEDYKEVATSVYKRNVDREELKTAKLEFQKTDKTVQAVARTSIKTLFAGLVQKESLPISVESEVHYFGKPESEPCIYTLQKNASNAFRLNSGANLQLENCGIHVHSTSNPAANLNAGINLSTDELCISGSTILNNDPTERDEIELNCEVDPDPYAGKVPVPSDVSCDYSNGNYNGSTQVMEPGVYCGWHNFNNSNAAIHFQPGTYILRNGGWNVNGGNWTGDGVTFYFYDSSKIQFNSGVKASMSAPTSGPYAGIFITERSGLSGSQFILNDSRGFVFEGDVYLPSREFVFNSGSSVVTRKMIVVAGSMIVNNGILKLQRPDSTTSVAESDIYISR